MKKPERPASKQKAVVLECIERGERAIMEGKVLLHADAKSLLSRWLR